MLESVTMPPWASDTHVVAALDQAAAGEAFLSPRRHSSLISVSL